jgi:hypothetical protein
LNKPKGNALNPADKGDRHDTERLDHRYRNAWNFTIAVSVIDNVLGVAAPNHLDRLLRVAFHGGYEFLIAITADFRRQT